MANSYATTTPKSQFPYGNVTRNEKKIVSYDVTIEPLEYDANGDAEYVITVNGKVIKRMNYWQAARLLGETK